MKDKAVAMLCCIPLTHLLQETLLCSWSTATSFLLLVDLWTIRENCITCNKNIFIAVVVPMYTTSDTTQHLHRSNVQREWFLSSDRQSAAVLSSVSAHPRDCQWLVWATRYRKSRAFPVVDKGRSRNFTVQVLSVTRRLVRRRFRTSSKYHFGSSVSSGEGSCDNLADLDGWTASEMLSAALVVRVGAGRFFPDSDMVDVDVPWSGYLACLLLRIHQLLERWSRAEPGDRRTGSY